MSDFNKAASDQKSVWRFAPGIALVLLLLASPVGFVLALPLLSPIYAYFVPAYSASAQLNELQATVKLQFHLSDNPHSGRALTVSTPDSSAKASMCGYDWAHYGRTELYLTERRTIAVISKECDYEISFGPLHIDDRTAASGVRPGRAVKFRSKSWTYLGAFDFLNEHRTRTLAFQPGGRPKF
jgi:hypothetical protein